MEMARQDQEDAESRLRGQAKFLQHMFSFVNTMLLKCAHDLHIANIINTHGGPMTLSQIVDRIPAPNPDINLLARIMRFLCHREIFAAYPQPDGGETLYGLTQTSKWLLEDADLSFSSLLAISNQVVLAPFYQLSKCVKEGGNAFEKAHGQGFRDFASNYPKFGQIVHESIRAAAKITMSVVLSEYKDGFNGVRSLVGMGGGIGGGIAEVVKAYPHVKGFNFDLPHVIETAHAYPGAIKSAGDMFKTIPRADAILLQWLIRDHEDDDCVKILRNCRKSIPEKTGKIIIIDVVLQPDGNSLFEDTRLAYDLMAATYAGGKERTELEWSKLLQEGGFPRYKIIKIPAVQSIIEAYPE